MADYQGEKFKSFIENVKAEYKKYGFSERPTNEVLAKILNVSSVQLNRYYKSKSLERDTVRKIVAAFNVTESDIWDEVETGEKSSDQKPNLYIVPFKSYAGFLRGYGDGVGTIDNIEKIYYPLIKGEGFAFQVGGQSAYPAFPENTWFVGKPIDGVEDLVKGRIYTWHTIDGIITKIFEGMDDEFFYISSVNEDYNPVKPLHRKDVKVIYRKVGKIDNFEN